MTTTVAAAIPVGGGVPTSNIHETPALRAALRNELLRLAAVEEDLAADEASRVHYWEACPASVGARREAARMLRACADRALGRADGGRG